MLYLFAFCFFSAFFIFSIIADFGFGKKLFEFLKKLLIQAQIETYSPKRSNKLEREKKELP